MRAGITLIIIGGIFAFAVRAESSWLDVQAMGLILIIGGAALVAYARAKVRRRETTVVQQDGDGSPEQVERTVVTEQRDGWRP
jgi:uncharacterized membrane protein HdeD (DUF308 family)